MLFRYANRHDFIARPTDCSRREPSFFFYPLAALPQPPIFLLFVHQTESSCCCSYYGNGDSGSSGSRKSQINPFVIPHRSFSQSGFPLLAFTPPPQPPKSLPPFLFRLPCQPTQRELFLVPFASFSLSLLSLPSLPPCFSLHHSPISRYPIFATSPSYTFPFVACFLTHAAVFLSFSPYLSLSSVFISIRIMNLYRVISRIPPCFDPRSVRRCTRPRIFRSLLTRDSPYRVLRDLCVIIRR